MKWEKRGGKAVRQLINVELVDVAPVIGPAYPNTEVLARTLEEARRFVASRRGVPNEINALRLRLNDPGRREVPNAINWARLRLSDPGR